VSLQSTWHEEIPEDTAGICDDLLAPNDVYRVVGDRAHEILQEKDFADMYAKMGRGAIHPIILALVCIFQFLENLPDREAAKWARMRIDWKYALHLPLVWAGFHHSTLSYYRKRLLEHKRERLVFDRVLEWLRSHGYLKKHGRQRSDSTHILGHVARLSRLELVWETLRLALGAIQQAVPQWYEKTIPAVFHECYYQRKSDWRLSAAEVKAELQKAGRDGYWLLKQLAQDAGPQVCALAQVRDLRQVLAQQFEWQAGEVRTRKPPIKGKDVLQSPHDREARYAEKRSTKWVGYKTHVTETANREETNFLTDIDAVDANEDDSESVEDIHARLQEAKLKPKRHFVDRGYISGQNLAHSAERGIQLLGPALRDTSPKPKGFKQADFDIDFQQQVVTCPGGQTSVSWLPRPQEDGHVGAHVLFKHKCADCAHRALCAPGSSGRSLEISPYYAELTARRREAQTAAFKEEMKNRPAIEGTLSELVRKHGLRRARYRGKAKVRLQHLFTGAAVNLKRLTWALEAQRKPKKALATGC
jgi:transposase